MSNYRYERLSALDTSFLAMEDDNAFMHMAGTSIFERGALATADGGVDFEKIEALTERLLPLIPRYRQKLRWIPLENHPVWVDDSSFNLHYHLRHTSLPRPGTIRQLKRLSARIMSQPLDRSKPLWENWIVEGLEGDRFAVIGKVHHCMLDGVGAVDLANVMMSAAREDTRELEPHQFVPKPAPTSRELVVDELLRRARLPFQALSDLRRARESERGRAAPGEAGRARAVRDTLAWALRRPTPTPLNGPIGPHRRFDWTRMPLDDIKQVGKALGGSINDVVLAIATGAIREFLRLRGTDPRQTPFRALTPVNVRTQADDGTLGNRISAWLVDLPVDEADPRERLARLVGQTRGFKHGHQASGGETLIEATEWLPGALFALAVRGVSHALPFNIVITNVPGFPQPGYMLGAELLETYGMVPLVGQLALGIAVTSYNGRIFWGLNADWELVPDLHDFVEKIDRAFEELREVAGLGPAH